MTSYSTLRERVRDVLLEAGFRAREDTIPSYLTGGTFALKPGAGVVAVRVDWWDASDGERDALLLLYAVKLAGAGFIVENHGDAYYVYMPEKRSDEEKRLSEGLP